MSEDDIRGKRGSTTYESCKENLTEESGNKATNEITPMHLKIIKSESGGVVKKQLY